MRLHWNGTDAVIVVCCFAAVYTTRDLGSVVVMAAVLWICCCFGFPLALCNPHWCRFFTLSELHGCADGKLSPSVFWHFLILGMPAVRWVSLQQSYMTLASGGMSGAGLGEAHRVMRFCLNDILILFMLLQRRLGLIGGSAVAMLFLLLVGLGFISLSVVAIVFAC